MLQIVTQTGLLLRIFHLLFPTAEHLMEMQISTACPIPPYFLLLGKQQEVILSRLE